MIQKEKTALGNLTPEQLATIVGTKMVRERLNCQQGGEIEIIRGRVDSNIGLTLFDLIMGESDVVDVATFRNISNLLSVPFRFQRNFVKTIVEQQLIISAIFKKQLLNPLYFSLVRNENKIEIIDGQQRWTTLKNFVNNEFPLGVGTIVSGLYNNGKKVDLSGLYYNDIINYLPNGEQLIEKLFSDICLPVVIYEGTEQQIRNLFIELNTGATGLNKIEILLANQSNVYDYAREINNKGVFDKVPNVDTLRFGASELVLKFLDYFLNGARKVDIKDLEDLKDRDVPSKFKKTIADIENFISLIPEKGKSQFGKGHIRLLAYTLIDLRNEYDLLVVDRVKFYDFVRQMFLSITKSKGTIVGSDGKTKHWLLDIIRYNDKDSIIAMTAETSLYIDMKLGDVNGDIEEFTKLNGFSLREVNRNVTKTQRWQVLINNPNCPICKKPVHLGDDAHHIEHYAKGGKNDVENIVILHKQCHIDHHKNDIPLEIELETEEDLND
jgi:hypothetical protein